MLTSPRACPICGLELKLSTGADSAHNLRGSGFQPLLSPKCIQSDANNGWLLDIALVHTWFDTVSTPTQSCKLSATRSPGNGALMQHLWPSELYSHIE